MILKNITKILVCLLFYATSFAASSSNEAQLEASRLKHEYILEMHNARAQLKSASDDSKLAACVKAALPNQLNSSDIAELRKILSTINRSNIVTNEVLKKKMQNLDALFSIEQGVELYKERLKFLKDLGQTPQLLVSTKDIYGWKGSKAFEGVALSCTEDIKKSVLVNTLKKLSGKIFIVNTAENRVEFCGSGMIVPKFEHDQPKWVLRTCKHNFKAPQGYEYYFVPSELLNAETGQINTSDGKTEVEFLRSPGDQVIKIQIPGAEPSTSPHADDSGIAHAMHPETILKTVVGKTVTIIELADQPNFTDEIVDYELTAEQISVMDLEHVLPRADYITTSKNFIKDKRYYAVGYPLYPNLATPLVITSACTQPTPDDGHAAHASTFKLYSHGAPTSAGMSGGAVFYFDEGNDKIILMGIIANGKFNKNYMLAYP